MLNDQKTKELENFVFEQIAREKKEAIKRINLKKSIVLENKTAIKLFLDNLSLRANSEREVEIKLNELFSKKNTLKYPWLEKLWNFYYEYEPDIEDIDASEEISIILEICGLKLLYPRACTIYMRLPDFI